VLVLSASAQWMIACADCGWAAMTISHSFAVVELVARIEALLRRPRNRAKTTLRLGRLSSI